MISLNELRHHEYQAISRVLHSVFEITLKDIDVCTRELARISAEVRAFGGMNEYLFKSMDDRIGGELVQRISDLSGMVGEHAAFDEAYERYVEARDAFLSVLRRDLEASVIRNIAEETGS